jgi:predicted component of type VI protein secretion system
MSSITIRDLSHSKELDRSAMSAVHGGTGYGKYADVNVNVGVVQNMVQLQNVEVNTLNNVGSIGAGFHAPAVDVSPMQMGKLSANPSIFF